ncbi:ATP-binding protein [Puniceicoccaceae bacterium K14]|nr:ATP-binding protein [Puniceicoccaceae bacterium K14]
MRIYSQTLVVVLVCSLGALLSFIVVGYEYKRVETLRTLEKSETGIRSDVERFKTMSSQWFVTIDLFFGYEQTYLISGIERQSKDLISVLEQIDKDVLDESQHERIRKLEEDVASIMNLTMGAVIGRNDELMINWNRSLSDFDEKSMQFIENVETVFQAADMISAGLKERIVEAETRMFRKLYFAVATYFLSILLCWRWATIRTVKPIEELSRAARSGINQNFSSSSNLVGPYEVQRLRDSLYDYSINLEAAKAKAENEAKNAAVAERRVKDILDTAPNAIFSLDGRGEILLANHTAEHMFNYLEDELLQLNLTDILTGVSDPIDFLEKRRLENSFMNIESEAIRKSGEVFPVEISFNSVDNGAGDMGYVVMLHDITQRKQIESNLNQARKLEAVGQLAAGIAHEINTPIQYIGDNSEFLQECVQDFVCLIDVASDVLKEEPTFSEIRELSNRFEDTKKNIDFEYLKEEAPKASDQMLSGVRQVRKIVSSMKTFSHPGENCARPTNLNETIEGAIAVAANEWKYVSKVETELEESLPEVLCYANNFGQVIINLVVNAAHAIEDSNDGKEMGLIHISTRTGDENAEIRITDNGTGMSDEIVEKVFDPFFTTKAVGKGTGQGLSIAYGVIKKHNGSIEIESEVGKGTTFIIKIPLDQSRVNNPEYEMAVCDSN